MGFSIAPAVYVRRPVVTRRGVSKYPATWCVQHGSMMVYEVQVPARGLNPKAPIHPSREWPPN